MFNQQQQSQINSTLLNELLQVMSAFNAKICIEVQLLLWFLLWFGEGFEMRVAALVSLIVRWQRHRPVYLSRASTDWKCSEEKTCRRYACRKRRASPVEGAFGESAVKLLASALIPS